MAFNVSGDNHTDMSWCFTSEKSRRIIVDNLDSCGGCTGVCMGVCTMGCTVGSTAAGCTFIFTPI